MTLSGRPSTPMRRILCLPIDGVMLALALVLLVGGALLWVLRLARSYLVGEE